MGKDALLFTTFVVPMSSISPAYMTNVKTTNFERIFMTNFSHLLGRYDYQCYEGPYNIHCGFVVSQIRDLPYKRRTLRASKNVQILLTFPFAYGMIG